MQLKMQPLIKTVKDDIDIIENNLFSNQEVYIIGGGNSINQINIENLKDKNTICINKSVFNIPNPKVLYFSDYRFYMWYNEELKKIKCIKYTIANQIKDADYIILSPSGNNGLELRKGHIKQGNNSGYAAINLAYHLGAKTIYLLGFDMEVKDKTHFHGGYKEKQKEYKLEQDTLNRFKKSFDNIDLILKKLNINIFNVNDKKTLNTIQNISIESFNKKISSI